MPTDFQRSTACAESRPRMKRVCADQIHGDRPAIRVSASGKSHDILSFRHPRDLRALRAPSHSIRATEPRRVVRSGQSLIEFVVALVCILALFAGLLQMGLLGIAQTQTMKEARRGAGQQAMRDTPLAPLPDYIQDWEPGPDGKTYSADDEIIDGDTGSFNARVLAHAHPLELDTVRPGNVISTMSGSASPHGSFGLVQGNDQRTVDLLPAVQHLIYGHETITIRSEVWLGWTQGIY